MCAKRIWRNKGFVYFNIFVFLLLIVQPGIPANRGEEGSNEKPSYRLKKSAQVADSATKEKFEKLFSEAKSLYQEMDYEGAIKKLIEAKDLASTAMQKADVNLYLSLAYYATSEGKKITELVSAIENVITFDYLRELDPSLCPAGYIEIFHELKAGFGSLYVQSTPPGADVYIDRTLMGKSPLRIGAKPGSAKILVKLGKKEKQAELDIAAGQETTSPNYDLAEKKGRTSPALIIGVVAGVVVLGVVLAIVLDGGDGEGGKNGDGGATTGSIQVNSTPTGAKVYLDGSDMGRTTNCTLTNISPGSHTVKLTKDGYSDIEQSVSVTAGRTATVNLTLTKDTITVTLPAAGTTWTLGDTVTISWSVSSTLMGQSQFTPVVRNPASLLNQHRLSARYLRASRLAAARRTGPAEGFNRSGRGLSLERQGRVGNLRGSPVQANASPGQDMPSDQFGTTRPSPSLLSPPLQKARTQDKAEVLDIARVKLELYKGSDPNNPIEIIPDTENDGSHSWSVPSTLASGSDYKVRVSCTSDESVYGESGAFTISAGYIRVTFPREGMILTRGRFYYIYWDSNLGGAVNIDLYNRTTFVRTLALSVRNDGEWGWTIPLDLSGSNFNILISSVGTSGVSGRSGNFTIF